MLQTDLADLVADAAEEVPERLAVVETGGRGRTWARAGGRGRVVRDRAGRARHPRRARVMIVIGNRLEFVTTYLGVLRAQVVAVPVNPRSTAGELARMIADSGTRLVVADPAALDAVRVACAQVTAALDGVGPSSRPTRRRAHRPRIVAVDAAPGAGEVAFADVLAAEARALPPLPDPEKLAALLYTSGTSGRPRAAMLSHRALLANLEQVGAGRAADDARRRRRARGAAALPRLRPQRRARRGAAAPRPAAAGRAVRPAGRARPDRRRGVQRACRSRRRSSPTGCPTSTSTSGSARCASCSPARRRWSRR